MGGKGDGAAAEVPRLVGRDSDAAHAGDEPVLLARSGFPVAVARDRAAAAPRAARRASRVQRDPGG